MTEPSFHSISDDCFPFVIQALDEETLEKLWQQVVTGPGVVRVPGFAPRAVRTRIFYSNGIAVETRPDGTTRVYDLSADLAEIKTALVEEKRHE